MNLLEKIKGKKIALYGLGTETERTIQEWKGQYEIIGLLDGYQDKGEQFGYPILNIKDVVQQNNIVIIVVARPGSCKAIARRIGDLCCENRIELYDIRGADLLQRNRVVYDFKGIKGYKYEDILEAIRKAEVVSFDLFDTLLTRDVLSSADVIELVDIRLREQGIVIPNFVKKRIHAEKNLSRGKAPRLAEIYQTVLADLPDLPISEEELSRLEYETDHLLLQPRRDMLTLIAEVKGLGKQVYITSESYYSRSQIEKILIHNKITGIDQIIVSCEYNVGKTSGLFEVVKEFAGTDKILHIGDDIAADMEAAKRSGLRAFLIYSTSDLLDAAGGLRLYECMDSISDKIKIGMFIANIFNSPFAFEKEEKQIQVNHAFDIGYLFCAPMIMDFTYWFGKQVQRNDIKNIWFCARDGYLLQKLYQLLYPDQNTSYYLASRISAIRAGVSEEADIEYVDSMKFSGNLEDELKVRFGLEESSIKASETDNGKLGLLKFSKSILAHSALKKANNQKYIEKMQAEDGKVALFDFVAKGTVQMFTQKLISNKILGLYFLQLEPEFMQDKELEILPFYTEAERDTSAIFDDYYILETLLTSPEASVIEFDNNGKPVYAPETRSDQDIACFMSAQDGILKYVERFLCLCPQSEIRINKKLDEAFLALVHNVDIGDKDFLALTVEDPFFNRMTDITNVI